MSSSFDYLFKFILIGDSSVGKSCLLNRFVEGKFKNEHDPTLGVQFGCKNITIDGVALKVQIWDTAGQQSFKSITRSYYKGSVAAFLLFDITRRSSFQNLNKWLFQIKNYSHQSIQIVLVGNKADLSSDRQISKQQAEKFAKQNNYQYYESSALTGQNVSQPFQNVSKRILQKIQTKQIDPQAENVTIQKLLSQLEQNQEERKNRLLMDKILLVYQVIKESKNQKDHVSVDFTIKFFNQSENIGDEDLLILKTILFQ